MIEAFKNLFFEQELDVEGKQKSKKNTLSNMLTNPKKDFWIIAIAVIFLLNYILLVGRYIYCFIYLDRVIISNSLWYLLPAGIFPYAFWVLLTTYEHFNFYKLKLFVLRMIMLHTILVTTQMIYTIFWDISIPLLVKVNITQYMTRGLITITARLILGIFVILSIYLQGKLLFPLLKDIHIKEKVEVFKLKHVIDTRENKENLYDLTFLKNLETGRSIKIKQNDRYTHMLITGGSGMGKSALAAENIILSDMNKKYKNAVKREKELLEMLQKGEAYINGPFAEFDEKFVSPYPDYKEKFKKIYETYPDCGITIMAPDDSMINHVVEWALARNIKVNVIDPTREKPLYPNERIKGLDQFYVPLDLNKKDLAITITERANVFTEMLVTVNEIRGRVETYFEGINKSLTRSVAITCMLYANLNGRQTNFTEIQDCLGDFSMLQPMVNDICNKLDITIEVSSISNNKRGITGQALSKSMEEIREENEKRKESRKSPFYRPLYVVKQELLGDGAEDLFSQGRGLRNLIDYILGEVHIQNILVNDDCLNFENVLDNNEITVINTALEYGEQYSKVLGIITLYSMKIATFRRDPNTSSLHTLVIDETPQYMDPMFETMTVLFRKYHINCIFAIQTFSQFEKTDMTRYLKGIFKTCGTHIMFGRANEEEMETYSKLSGMEAYNMVQATKSTNSIFSENPSKSKSDRITESTRTVLEGRKVRLRDFQEVTVLSLDEGRVKDAQLAKMFFISKKEKEEREGIPLEVWKKYIPSHMAEANVATLHLIPTEEKKSELQQLVAKSNMVYYPGEILSLDSYGREALEEKIEEGHNMNNNHLNESMNEEEIKQLLNKLDNEER